MYGVLIAVFLFAHSMQLCTQTQTEFINESRSISPRNEIKHTAAHKVPHRVKQFILPYCWLFGIRRTECLLAITWNIVLSQYSASDISKCTLFAGNRTKYFNYDNFYRLERGGRRQEWKKVLRLRKNRGRHGKFRNISCN